jgi:hypothetical protein
MHEAGHYWACTWAAGLFAARAATNGGLPGTADEYRALAMSSDDPDLFGGSNTGDLLEAVQRRYGWRWTREPIGSQSEWRSVCSRTGTVLVVAVTAGAMPSSVRAFYGSFTGGHRTSLVPEGHGKVRVFDPLMPGSHAGVVVSADSVWPALWRNDVLIVPRPRELD